MNEAIAIALVPAAEPGPDPLISIVVPLAPTEPWPDALLAFLPRDAEIILARGGSRAASLNRGASQARGQFLWFIHADTQLSPQACGKLVASLAQDPKALRYFDLTFDQGGAMHLTALGVWLRSHLLGLPFGDQAFCLPAATFRSLGGYDETLSAGEDHRLVWRARQAGVPLRPVGATLVTSARKYRERGWLSTTCRHLWLTTRQAWPQCLIMLSQGRKGPPSPG
jgi:hypothetical protein